MSGLNQAMLHEEVDNFNSINECSSSQERWIVYEQVKEDDDVNFKIKIRAPGEECRRSIRYGRYQNQDRRFYFTIERVSTSLSSGKLYDWERYNKVLSYRQKDFSLRQLAVGLVSLNQQNNIHNIKVRLNLGKLLFRQEDPQKKVARILNSERDYGKLCQNLHSTEEDKNVTTQFCTCIPDGQSQNIEEVLTGQLGFQEFGSEETITIYASVMGDVGGQQYVSSYLRNQYDDGFVNYELRKTRLGYRKKWFLTFMQDSDLIDGRFKVCENRRLCKTDIPLLIQQFQKDCSICLNKREYKNVHGAIYQQINRCKIYLHTSRRKQKKMLYGFFRGLPFKVSLTQMEVESNNNLQQEVSIWSRDMDQIFEQRLNKEEEISQVYTRISLMHQLYQTIVFR